MKRDLNNFNFEVEELSQAQLIELNGGSWLSYALGYIFGTLENVAEAYTSTPEGKAVQQALRDFQ